MARNKYPEETVKKILDVAQELFMTKGYERTTMADIVDNLGGLTKGAVYHHFKSKEEIFEAMFERINAPVVEKIEQVAADPRLTGLEKLRAFDRISAASGAAEMWRAVSPASDPVKNARLLAQEYADALQTARTYIEPAIREGVADGSMQVEYPREAAEVILLLANLWMVPLFHPAESEDEYYRRAEVLLRVAHALGVDLLDPAQADAHDWGSPWAQVSGGEGAERTAGGSNGAEPRP